MRGKALIAAAAFCVMAALPSYGAIILNSPETFDTTGNWEVGNGPLYVGPGNSTISQGTGGPNGNFLQINMNYGAPVNPLDAVVSNLTDYAGDHTDLILYFDFYASNAAPSQVFVFFETSLGDLWSLEISDQILGTGWSQIAAGFSTGNTGWGQELGASTLADSFVNVTTVGLFIEGDTGIGGTQVFGIDNWVYSIPEPGTMAMLSAAFLSMGMTFRRSLRDGVDRLKQRLKS